MLAYALAIAVALSSLILFLTAFIFSDIHRQDDFFWSAIGFIYALILWFCATRITGAVLLGQSAAVALLVAYQWQTLKLRKAIAHPEKAAELDNFSVLKAINNLFSRRPSVKTPVQPTIEQPKVTEEKIAIPQETSESAAIDEPATETTASAAEVENAIAVEKDSMASTPAIVDSEEAEFATQAEIADTKNEKATKTASAAPETKQPGFFGRLFGRKKKPTPAIDTQLNEILEEEITEEQPTDSTTTPVTKTETVTDEPPTETSATTAELVTEDTSTETSTTDIETETEDSTTESMSVTAFETEPPGETTIIEENESLEAQTATSTAEENIDVEPTKIAEVETPEANPEAETTESTTENIVSSETETSTAEIDEPEVKNETNETNSQRVENFETKADETENQDEDKPVE